MMRNPVRMAAAVVLMIMSLLCAFGEARAQSAVGGGPLTTALDAIPSRKPGCSGSGPFASRPA